MGPTIFMLACNKLDIRWQDAMTKIVTISSKFNLFINNWLLFEKLVSQKWDPYIVSEFSLNNRGERVIFTVAAALGYRRRVERQLRCDCLQVEWEVGSFQHRNRQLEEMVELLLWVRWTCPSLSSGMPCFLRRQFHFVLTRAWLCQQWYL